MPDRVKPILRKGDTIAVPAPSGPVTIEPFSDRLTEGLDILRAWELTPIPMGCDGPRDGYLAAPDEIRIREVSRALADESVQAVWAARGGYGMVRIAGALNLEGQAQTPVLGFSDITLLLSLVAQRSGRMAIHAPNVATLPTMEAPESEVLHDFLFLGQLPRWSGLECINGGLASGPLLPMNLSILCSVAGTPLEPDLSGHILLLEDTGENAYRVDRLLMQLSLLPGFSRVAGLLLGDMDRSLQSPRLVRTLREIVQRFELPACIGFPIGHCPRNLPAPYGLQVTLDADKGALKVSY